MNILFIIFNYYNAISVLTFYGLMLYSTNLNNFKGVMCVKKPILR